MLSYQEQLRIHNTPAKLFEKPPRLTFVPEQKLCPIDGCSLKVQKTGRRIIKTLGIGTFHAHYTVLYCPEHPHLGTFDTKELGQILPSNSNVAYDVIVKIGLLRFQENRQVAEIKNRLFIDHSVDICLREIELLIDKFVFYLAAVHQESKPLIRAHIKARGGYILHLDSTCDGDSLKLASSIDSTSGFVLHCLKLNSENADEIEKFLIQVKDRFGNPLAVVSDMSKGIEKAVSKIFNGIHHYFCHYHFLSAVGISLFEKENNQLRNALSKAAISGKLKELRKKMNSSFEKSSPTNIDIIDDFWLEPLKYRDDPNVINILSYSLIEWILDHGAEGDGYGFPFDQRYLAFYDRLHRAQIIIKKITETYAANTRDHKILWKIFHQINPIAACQKMQDTAADYRQKVGVFFELRQALAIAPEGISNGLTQIKLTNSKRELKKIRIAVTAFTRNLDKQLKTEKKPTILSSLTTLRKKIENYSDKLFADPIVVPVNGQQKTFFVHRTNNILENHFRLLNYLFRRIHGNHSIRQNLEKIPDALPLVTNLKNPEYIKIMFEDESKIAEKFAKIDPAKIREMADKHTRKKRFRSSSKRRKMLRKPNFKDTLSKTFDTISSYVYSKSN